MSALFIGLALMTFAVFYIAVRRSEIADYGLEEPRERTIEENFREAGQ